MSNTIITASSVLFNLIFISTILYCYFLIFLEYCEILHHIVEFVREGERGNFENEIEEKCDFHGYGKQFSTVKLCMLHQFLNHWYWNNLAQKLTLFNFRTNLSSADEWSNSCLPQCCWLKLCFMKQLHPCLTQTLI